MKRLFNVFLMLSVISTVIPAHAVAHGPEIRNNNKTLAGNCKVVLAAAITVGTLAAAVAYMSATSAMSAAPALTAVDCNLVAQAHCAGEQIPWPLLEQCKDQLQSAYWPVCVLKMLQYCWLSK